MPKKQGKQNQEQLVVSVRHIHTPDVDLRLSKSIEILLDASTRRSTKHEKDKKRHVGAIRITKEEI